MTPNAADGHDRKQLATERPVTESRIKREGLKAGTRAPLFSLPDLDGRAISLEEYRGRRVLLVFSDPNCGPCNALAPELVRLDAENSALQLLMVSRGDLEENRLKAREHGFMFPVVLQDAWNLSKEYGIFATPVAFLIDEEGVIERPVAIGADAILALAATPAAPSAISRWRAIGRIAAGLITAIVMTPLRAAAALVCPPGRVNCGRTCADLNSDPRNCGACGRVCPAGQTCEPPPGRVGANLLIESKKGMCRPCTAPRVICAGKCVDLAADPRNCGACGKTCPEGDTCVNGACRGLSPVKQKMLCARDQVVCAGKCVDLRTDPLNCGACGKTCPLPTFGPAVTGVCVAGACKPCDTGQAICGGRCVNLSIDPNNCGACGKTCPSGICGGPTGKCLPCPVSPPGLVLCTGKCVNVGVDPLNCGACGKTCAPGLICYNGVCTKGDPCPPGLQRCNTLSGLAPPICTDVTSDVFNCGACGRVCPGTGKQTCKNGVCA